jgi:hypothetical protein
MNHQGNQRVSWKGLVYGETIHGKESEIALLRLTLHEIVCDIVSEKKSQSAVFY